MQIISQSLRRLAVFFGTVIGTAIIGLAIGFMGSLIGAFVLRDELFGFGDLAGAIAGMTVRYPIGVIVGLLVASKAFHRRGSLLLGALGSILSVVGTMLLAEPLNLNLSPNLVFGSMFVASPLLASAGFLPWPTQAVIPGLATAEVYKFVNDKLILSPSNCLHCQTCRLKCPHQVIKWEVPEGGDGPRYKLM